MTNPPATRMTTPPGRVEVVINYSPKLDLRITLLEAQGHGDLARPDFRFEMECLLRHPSGSFRYSADNLYFDLESFERFSEELHGVQQGLREEAALKDMGEMVVLRLEGTSRAFQAKLDIREYLVPTIATLSATVEVEYDLFVNKLRGEIKRFVGELRNVEPLGPWRPGL